MIVTIMSYNPERDKYSKEPLPVYLFDQKVGSIEFGLFVRWENLFEKRNKRMAPPISCFFIGTLYYCKGIDLDSKDDVVKLMKKSPRLFGDSLINVFKEFVEDYLDGITYPGSPY